MNKTRRWRSRLGRAACALMCSVVLGTSLLTSAPASAADAGRVELQVLSNRADLVSGGDALVEVVLPEGVDPQGVRVSVEGRDVTDAFALHQEGRLLGLVTGMREGDNEVVARPARGTAASLVIRNHPITGPVFAGPQVQPFVCETEQFGLGEATDESCSAPTRHDFFYKSAVTGTFAAYDPESPPPDALVAETTTDEGETVPYVVRRERGVIDRGIYDIAVLFDPRAGWHPGQPQPGWNRKLYYKFGGGCSPSHRQAATGSEVGLQGPEDVLLDAPLSRGFAVANSTLNRLHNNCNDVVAAESLMMVKEHLIETYGPIRYTIGAGCSGGSIQQHLIAANYPGLLDGIIPWCSFPDIWTGLTLESVDCALLNRYFQANAGLWADPLARRAVTGYASDTMCNQWDTVYEFDEVQVNPSTGCTIHSPESGRRPDAEWVYDAESNPGGVRCTLQDFAGAVFGRDPETGFAGRPLDNVGVEYGLLALRRGEISAEQFVDLNEKLGGWDIDYEWMPQRYEADRDALRIAYQSGRITDGGELARVPIIDVRGSSNYDIHSDVHTKSLRARVAAANDGQTGNHVAWITPAVLLPEPPVMELAFTTMDRWLAAMEADTSGASLAEKVLRNKPVDAVDTCFVAGKPGACGSGELPSYATPRIASGAPVANNVLKCQLREIDWARYPVEFTAEQRDRLRAAFPDGVCDYSRPGVEQQPPTGPWQTYADGPGGQLLPPPPTSTRR